MEPWSPLTCILFSRVESSKQRRFGPVKFWGRVVPGIKHRSLRISFFFFSGRLARSPETSRLCGHGNPSEVQIVGTVVSKMSLILLRYYDGMILYDILWHYTVNKSRLHHAPSGFLWVLHIPRRNAVVCPTYLCLLRWLPRCSRHSTGAVAANATMLRRSHRSWSTHSKRGRGICASHSETWSCQDLPGLAMPGVSFGRSNKVWTELWKLIASNCI